MKILYETWKVTIAHEWQKKFNEEHTGSTFTFASLEGCYEYVDEQVALGKKNADKKVLWYCIEGLQHIPCDESKPWGQTYQGVIHHEFRDFT